MTLVGTNLQSGLTSTENTGKITYTVTAAGGGGGGGGRNLLNLKDIENILSSISDFFRILQETIKNE